MLYNEAASAVTNKQSPCTPRPCPDFCPGVGFATYMHTCASFRCSRGSNNMSSPSRRNSGSAAGGSCFAPSPTCGLALQTSLRRVSSSTRTWLMPGSRGVSPSSRSTSTSTNRRRFVLYCCTPSWPNCGKLSTHLCSTFCWIFNNPYLVQGGHTLCRLYVGTISDAKGCA